MEEKQNISSAAPTKPMQPAKQKSAAGAVIGSIAVTTLVIGGISAGIAFFFINTINTENQRTLSTQDARLTELESSLSETEADLEDANAQILQLETEKDELEEMSKKSSTTTSSTTSASKTVTDISILSSSELGETQSGLSFTETDLLSILPSGDYTISRYVADGLDGSVIYIQADLLGDGESTVGKNEFYRIAFEDGAPQTATKIFEQEYLSSEASSSSRALILIGRDGGDLVFTELPPDASPGPCANPWLENDSEGPNPNLQKLNLSLVAEAAKDGTLEELDPSDNKLSPYTVSDETVAEQESILKECAANL